MLDFAENVIIYCKTVYVAKCQGLQIWIVPEFRDYYTALCDVTTSKQIDSCQPRTSSTLDVERFWCRFIDEDDSRGPLHITGGLGIIGPEYWSPTWSAVGRQRVYRRTGERYADNCVQERYIFGEVNILAWAGCIPVAPPHYIYHGDNFGAGVLTVKRLHWLCWIR